MFARVQVEHELFERALEAGQRPFQYDETRARHFRGRVEIHEAQPLPDLEMLFGFKPFRKGRPGSVLANLDIVALVLAVRRIGERQIGNRGQFEIERGSSLPLRRLHLRHGRLEACDLGSKVVGRHRVLARQGHADLLRNRIAPLLRALERQDRRPALFIERDQRFRARSQAAAPHALIESFRILADRSDIVHDLTLGGGARRRRRPLELGLEPRP